MSGFVAGTLIHTDQGLLPIQNIKVGDLVLSKSDSSVIEYRNVTEVSGLLSEEILRISCFKNAQIEESYPVIYTQFAAASQLFWVESTVEVQAFRKWIVASKLDGCSLLSNISDEKSLRFLDSHTVWYGCLEGGLSVGGCFELTFEETRELDMIIQFTDDNYYFVNHNKYNSDYYILESQIIKSDYINDRAVDYIYNTHWNVPKPKKLAVRTYNLEIDGYNSYFIGEDGLWVHS
ncbi:hypothetical protein F941_01923 [Acinetobacter bouvetii DSM 14964 = CIP 107468]|uniref:Hint domain-containing protein n=1 Tax=Acinetobacter bouvetii DSM 14964 = CIP 107468 TaxID=1120925 RepID=N9DIT7_9GAMM|nr:hypothetical protein [Acinetobacter bouvetii]ENV82529.1 hypothetical protein F941_01923 [Acinetobacter bouvetii DSM 14964 = CIP 107468]BCU64472.1 hypothetical protein ACBO_12630 [Acinetobacter bouvetii]